MQRYAINVSYLGRKYSGWQKTTDPNVRSVQGALERVMERFMGGIKTTVYGSGRTDAGVHAANQIVHVDIIYQTPLRHQALQTPGASSPIPSTLDTPPTNDSANSIYAYESLFTNLVSWRHFCHQQEDMLRKMYPKKSVKAAAAAAAAASSSSSLPSSSPLTAPYTPPQRQGGARKSRHDTPIASPVTLPTAHLPTRSLPTLVAVRILPVTPPVCIIAASAAIDVVKRDRQYKYQFSYSRLCVMGLRGVKTVHCTLGLCKYLYNLESGNSHPEIDLAGIRCSNDYYRTPCDCGLTHDEVVAGIKRLTNEVTPNAVTGKDAVEDDIPNLTEHSGASEPVPVATGKPAAPFYVNKYHRLLLERLGAPTVLVNKGVNITSLRPAPEKNLFRRILNEFLSEEGHGEEIVVNDVTPVPSSFHARFDPYRRRYIYRVLISPSHDLCEQGRVWHIKAHPSTFNTARAAYVADALMGRYNFNSFRHVHCQAKSPIRTVDKVELAWEPSFRERMQGYPLHVDLLTVSSDLDTATNAAAKEESSSSEVGRAPSDFEKLEHALSGMGLSAQDAFLGTVNNSMFGFDEDTLVAKPPSPPKNPQNSESARHSGSSEELRLKLHSGDLGFSEQEIDVINRFMNKTGLGLNSRDRAVPVPEPNASPVRAAITSLTVDGEKPPAYASVSSSTRPFYSLTRSTPMSNTPLANVSGARMNTGTDVDGSCAVEDMSFQGSVLTISVVARAFLHSQVRIMVGAIVDAGFGAYNHLDIYDNISRRDRGKNPAKTAPPDGLFLTNVVYPYSKKYRAMYSDLRQFEYDMLLASTQKRRQGMDEDEDVLDHLSEEGDVVKNIVADAAAAAAKYDSTLRCATLGATGTSINATSAAESGVSSSVISQYQ